MSKVLMIPFAMADSVFTKLTPNGKISLIVPKREFIDYLTYTQPIDGVIVVSPDYIHPDRSIAVQLVSSIRYGREDDEVMGLKLSKELCLASVIVNKSSPPEKLTKMQENLKEIHGDTCFPFHFEWPRGIGPSMMLLQPPEMKGEPCGIQHFLEVFCLYRGTFQPHKRSSIRFVVDAIQKHGSAEKSAKWIPPAASVSRPLLFSLGRIEMEACLEKTSVTDGEPLVINISIANQSNKSVKGMKITLSQFYKLSFSEGTRKIRVNQMEVTNGFPLVPGGTLNQTVMMIPRVPAGSHKSAVAVCRSTNKNSSLKLAASTLFAETDSSDIFGFIISYRVRVKLILAHSPLNAAVITDLPVFISTKTAAECNTYQSTPVEKCSPIIFRNRNANFPNTDKMQRQLSIVMESQSMDSQ